MKPLPAAEIDNRVDLAIDQLYEYDSYLLENNLHERTIVHRLAIYLEQQFPGWNVDCEYNNNCGDIKKVKAIKTCYNTKVKSDKYASTQRVYPDIIVHHRGYNTKNLLVIEVKKNDEENECDKLKLQHYKDDLGYQNALFLSIPTRVTDADEKPRMRTNIIRHRI